jgi:hypothetical protein
MQEARHAMTYYLAWGRIAKLSMNTVLGGLAKLLGPGQDGHTEDDNIG